MRSRRFSTTNRAYLAYLRSKEWLAKREQVIQRCQNVCERCGKYAVEEVHHLTYDRVYREELEDLQGLCGYCHDYVHGRRADDGSAVHEAEVKEKEGLRRKADGALAEIVRFCERRECYRCFSDTPMPSQQELIALLRRHSYIVGTGGRCEIVKVRLARRKYETVVMFDTRQQTPRGYALSSALRAEPLLRSGGMVLDTERGVWVDLDVLRSFVKRFGAASSLPAPILALPPTDWTLRFPLAGPYSTAPRFLRWRT
jgi:hypothetical protein